MRYGGGVVALTVLAVVLAACVSERARPMEPTGQGPRGGGGSSAPPSSDQARILVISPAEGDTVLRETLTESPGMEVVIRGEFMPGQSIFFEGRANRYGPIPFHSEVYEVQEEGITEVTRVFRAEVRHLAESDQALVRAQVKGREGTLLAADSAMIELR